MKKNQHNERSREQPTQYSGCKNAGLEKCSAKERNGNVLGMWGTGKSNIMVGVVSNILNRFFTAKPKS